MCLETSQNLPRLWLQISEKFDSTVYLCTAEPKLRSISLLGDYAAAASYYAQLAHLYAKDCWTHLELNMLNMYAHCLKQINQNEEFVRIGLKIVAKLAIENRTNSRNRDTLERKAPSLADLIVASTTLAKQLTVPLHDFFRNITVDPYVRPYNDHDGFYLQFRLTNLTSDVIEAQSIRAKLTSIDEGHPAELWVVADKVTLIQPGITVISLGSKVYMILLSCRFTRLQT